VRRTLEIAPLLLVAIAATAHADRATSLEHYEEGKQAYASGSFERALEEFDRAYQVWPAPEYLHDMAQALRRLGRCDEAIGHFVRYLDEKPDAFNRGETEERIAELRETCPRVQVAASPQQEAGPKAPQTRRSRSLPPARAQAALDVSGDAAPVAPIERGAAPAVGHSSPRRPEPSPWSAAASLGLAFLEAGPVVMPPVTHIALSGHLQTNLPFALKLGAGIGIGRLPYDDIMRGTVWLAGPEVIASGSHPLRRELALHAGAAVGANLVWGLGEGNPFTAEGRVGDLLLLPRARVELGLDWRASDRATVRLAPLGYQISPRRAPLAADIAALHGFSMSAGVTLDL
jgi:hypothetical protein